MSSRHDPVRLILGSYPHVTEVQTRFGDMDPLGHVNNVAMASLFETARNVFHEELVAPILKQETLHYEWLVAKVEINYLAETTYPGFVSIGSAIGRLGNRSRESISGAFQGGKCVALCDATLVYVGGKADGPFDSRTRTELEQICLNGLAPNGRQHDNA